MIKYELRYGNKVIRSEDYEALKSFTAELTVYWVIYKIICSELVGVSPSEMSADDKQEIIRLRSKNWTVHGIATRVQTSDYQVQKVLGLV